MISASGSVTRDGRSSEQHLPEATAQNALLSRLPARELDTLLALGTRVHCDGREILYSKGREIEHVYFPLTGMISLVTELKDGTFIEAMTVGCEGFAGLPVFHGVPVTKTMAMCQIKGEFFRIPSDSFTDHVKESPELAQLLHRYSQFANEVVSQSAACNSMHLIEQRCARWLLITADAVGSPEFGLTHEFLSQMLAVRRPGVTVAIGALEKAELIAHRYGNITILDERGLEKVACECYRTMKDRRDELLA